MSKSLALMCRTIVETDINTQRRFADYMQMSIGNINFQVNKAIDLGYVDYEWGSYTMTKEGMEWLKQYKVDNAIILAAGFGRRMVPFTFDTPKGLLTINNTPIINRQIEQLLEVGITDITIVVGYLAEKFEYLVDTYGVKLVYNPEYSTKNNFVSLHCVRDQLKNTYVLVADNWMEKNIFHSYEPQSWISCIYSEKETEDWQAVIGAHDRIVRMEYGAVDDWIMIGPAFFTREFSEKYVPFLEEYYTRPGTQDYFWEHIIKENAHELPIYISRQDANNVYEFEALEDLRAYDPSYINDSGNEILSIIAQVFDVSQADIINIKPMKEGGMTNRSFLFEVNKKKYVFRQPGLGTERLISRSQEKSNYELMKPYDITDEIIYFDGDSGIKITRYYNARVGNPRNNNDLEVMMDNLRRIHAANIQAEHRFDIEERINYYESLANERDSILFEDYDKVRTWADELLAFRKALAIPECLCHIDYIYANVLFLRDGSTRVIDWEYSGMADPIIDVAMFSIYSYYSKRQIDKLIRIYLEREPTRLEEARLYLYVALAGFLWCIWTEYKQGLGDDFGDYALEMYRYMKDYYHLLKKGGYLEELAS
ncbi:MAG: phosphotransferase [Coriobacteriia bacterium]|nr:phosphotransferase [Coriobacteriia bacterium]